MFGLNHLSAIFSNLFLAAKIQSTKVVVTSAKDLNKTITDSGESAESIKKAKELMEALEA